MGDAKSPTDAVGAAHQYSGALGSVGLCQVAVQLSYANATGHALIDRALYLTGDRGRVADEERRLLTKVPDKVAFAPKPQLAAAMLAEPARPASQPAGSPLTRSAAATCAAAYSNSASTTPSRCPPATA